MRQARNRKWRHLAEEHIENVTPQIPLGKKFWELSRKEKKEIDRIFSQEDVRNLATCLKCRDSTAEVSVLDAAYWMKGCSSLGRLRYAVLAGIGKKNSEGFSLIDIKEAVKPAAPHDTASAMPHRNAERVVKGAKALSPFLGDRMLAAQFEDRFVVLRELMPQDLKFEMEGLSQAEAIAAANLFAGVVGKAHARQMDRKTREGWAKELIRNRTKTLDAPSWLWISVVDLVASHEAAYLSHCRQYALNRRASRRRFAGQRERLQFRRIEFETTIRAPKEESTRMNIRSGCLAAMALLLAPSLSGCVIVGGYSSGGGWFAWPGTLGLLFIVLLVFFLRKRR